MYRPPTNGSMLPTLLFWLTTVCLAGAVYLSFAGNLGGDFYEHWLTMPLSVAAFFAHTRCSLLVIPIYLAYTAATFDRVMVAVYATQSSLFLLPAPILIGLMLILWATQQYRPLRRSNLPETPNPNRE